MIDLTVKFESSINIKNTSFNEFNWYSSFQLLAEKKILDFLWDEEDDNWIQLGTESELILMVARHSPLMFIKESFSLEDFVKIYLDKFVYEIIHDFSAENFCVEIDKISDYFPWHTDVVSSNKFSLEQLFYATH